HALYKTAALRLNIDEKYAPYFVFSDSVTNKAYSPEGFSIKVLYRNGQVKDIAEASDQYNITALTQPVRKYFLCYPKK
ncbi:MAG: phosphohydrolase, partial [Bacteroidota bacterium]